MTSTPNTRTGRPPVHGVEVVAVDIDGKRASWDSGRNRFRGDRDVVAYAKEAAANGFEVTWLGGPVHVASDADALAALHALVAFDEGRAVVTEWPDWVADWWEAHRPSCVAARDAETDEFDGDAEGDA